jgi:MFS family permease
MLRRSLIALITAEVISSLGTLMSVVALPWFVLETTGSPQQMTIVLAAEAAPLAVLALLSGRVATRLGARRTMLACDALWAPAPVRAGTMAVSYSFVFASGFLTLLAAGPLLDRFGATPVFAAVAAAQTVAAVIVGRLALRQPAHSPT